MKNEQSSGAGKKLLLGAGAIALAAGAYYFFGPEGKKHQKKMKSWMIKMKGDVVEKLEAAQEVTQPIYNSIVDSVASTYSAGVAGKEEVVALAKKLKKDWRGISKSFAPKIKKPVAGKSAKKIVKKAKKAGRA